MDDLLTLASAEDLADLTTFLTRASALGCEQVRLTVHATALVASVAVLTRATLLDDTPTVLGIRIFELAVPQNLDRVVAIAALKDRLARDQTTVPLPPAVPGVTWAGLAPPQDGWVPVGVASENRLNDVARAGIAEVASISGQGAIIVSRVRTTVWSRAFRLDDHDVAEVVVAGPDVAGISPPAGAAFAAYGLGFLSANNLPVRITRTGRWTRLSTTRGHVLVRA